MNIFEIAKKTGNPMPLGEVKKCKHGVGGLCTKCAYLNTGRRKSTDANVEVDVLEFMNQSLNKRLISYGQPTN